MRTDTARGQRIDALIRQSGLEPKQLAALWDCSESRISAVRRGAPFSIRLLLAMIDSMQWSADYILSGSDKNENAGALTLTPADTIDINLLQRLTPQQRTAISALLRSMLD